MILSITYFLRQAMFGKCRHDTRWKTTTFEENVGKFKKKQKGYCNEW